MKIHHDPHSIPMRWMKWTMAGGIRRAWRRPGAGFSAHGMVPTPAIAHYAATLLSELIRITPHFLYRNQVEALPAATIRKARSAGISAEIPGGHRPPQNHMQSKKSIKNKYFSH
jgi:hypothetical protein